jgi:oligosaccharide repeat unit polymerase
MFYHLCALALISLMLGLAAIRHCSIYSPLMISISVWMMTFISGLILDERFFPIQENAFIAWLIWFMVTCLIFFLLHPSRVKSACSDTEIRMIPVNYTLPLLILIVWLSYMLWIIGSTGPASFFANLRLAAIHQEGVISLGLIERFYPLIFSLFLFEHVYARQENKRIRLLLWCWMLLYALASMSKLAILTPVIPWAIIQGIKGRLHVKKIIMLAVVLFASMMSIHFMRAAPSYSATIENVLALYVYSPLVALGYINIDYSQHFGPNIFRFFYVIGNILGIVPMPDKTLVFIEVPEPTNVYTVMGPFYHDFGFLGVFCGAFFYGLFFSYLYLQLAKGRGLALVLFSGYSVVLIIQFFADILVSQFSGNLQLFIYTMAIFIASKKITYAR